MYNVFSSLRLVYIGEVGCKTVGSIHRYRKSKIDCLRFVMCSLLARSFKASFLWWPLTVLMKQKRQAVHAFKQSILLRCLWQYHTTIVHTLLSMSTYHKQKLCCVMLSKEAKESKRWRNHRAILLTNLPKVTWLY